ncbi:phosphatase PAP2 family protein [uncultured Variovorax sp.]|uniref:phosphatase PAP2 family protein n=1 Tax=uncultured Variovorax sp. TaxID=114708 RepID=UPI0025D8E280|nr:phosphatase PAP2 family protein [uncultured Variovorax sp.]
MTCRAAPSSPPDSSSPSSPAPWYRAVGRRIATHWVAKMIGTTAGIMGFFVLYFWVMHNPSTPPTVMPLTALDHCVRVSDEAMLLYGSLWFYISLPPAFAKGWAELRACARDAALMAGMGLAVFWFFPTTVPAFAIDWAQYPSLMFLKNADAGGNAFPSLHVAFAVFSAVLLERQLREVRAPAWVRVLNVLWALGIVYSTLATRQHVLLDVLGGTLLAAVVSRAGTARARLAWKGA